MILRHRLLCAQFLANITPTAIYTSFRSRQTSAEIKLSAAPLARATATAARRLSLTIAGYMLSEQKSPEHVHLTY